MDDGTEVIAVPDIKRFVIESFIRVGVSKMYSEVMADILVGADMIGHDSHGVYRLDKFLNDVQGGNVDIHASPRIEKESCATAWVDGMNALGPVVANFCMKTAIEKGKETGAAIVVANNSNNFGIASHYSKQALEEGMIGFAFTNSSSLMIPTRAKYPISGTNPISIAAPGVEGNVFLLDMATTVTSGGNIQKKYENGEYLPVGWAVNAACTSEINADVAQTTGRFLPLGSSEETASYKGTGLSIMVDILCGILGGAAYSSMVGIWKSSFMKQKANIGHCFIAINPKYFASGFEYRMNDLMSSITNATPGNTNKPVRIAGDKGRQMTEQIEKLGGISYPKYVINSLKKLSQQLNIKCVSFVPKNKPMDEISLEESVFSDTQKEMSIVPGSVEISTSEEDLTVVKYSTDQELTSFIIKDSSEWLCSFTDNTEEYENIGIKKQRLMSIMSEKTAKRSVIPQTVTIVTGEKTSIYSKVDEIVETKTIELRSSKYSL